MSKNQYNKDSFINLMIGVRPMLTEADKKEIYATVTRAIKRTYNLEEPTEPVEDDKKLESELKHIQDLWDDNVCKLVDEIVSLTRSNMGVDCPRGIKCPKNKISDKYYTCEQCKEDFLNDLNDKLVKEYSLSKVL